YFEKLLKTSQPQKQLPFIFPLLIALLSGAIFSLALAPYYFWWLAILSPALLYAVLRQRNPRQAFALGWAYGFGLWFVGAFWLYMAGVVRVGAMRATMLGTSEPVMATISAVAWTDAVFEPTDLVGFVMILIMVFLVR
ncbi:MAG: EamA family transporter, partial [Bifidobacterium adolescentis]